MFFFFKWPPVGVSKNHFLPFQINTIICIFVIWKSKTNFRWHFWPFQINTKLFFKTFSQNSRRRPFWMSEIHFWTHFWPFQIDMQFFIFDKMTAVHHISGHFIYIFFFYKMAAGAHFGCPKITFDRISGHFWSIGHTRCPKFTFDGISAHFRSIRILIICLNLDKMAAGGHFGCPKITFDHSSCHFRSIRNLFFWNYLTKWLRAIFEIFGWIVHVSSLKNVV